MSVATRNKRNREFLLKWLLDNPCKACGETDVRVLVCDHVTGTKRSTVTRLMGRLYSIERIQRELDKCQALCANCHARKTAKEQNWYTQRYYDRLEKGRSSSK